MKQPKEKNYTHFGIGDFTAFLSIHQQHSPCQSQASIR